MIPKDISVTDLLTLRQILDGVTMENTALDFRWEFEVADCRDCDNPGWFVNVAFTRPDTDTGTPGVGRGRLELIRAGSSESAVVKTAWLLIELVVRHELMEAFRYRGRRIFNPHNSVHALASIQGDRS